MATEIGPVTRAEKAEAEAESLRRLCCCLLTQRDEARRPTCPVDTQAFEEAVERVVDRRLREQARHAVRRPVKRVVVGY